MSEPLFPLQLNNYFFTHQEVIANPEHKQGKKHESKMHFDVNAVVSKINEGDSFSLEVTTAINNETSINPSYFIKISAFGIIDVTQDLDPEEIESLLKTSGSQILIGAIRERIVELTSRGPWQSTFIDFIQIN